MEFKLRVLFFTAVLVILIPHEIQCVGQANYGIFDFPDPRQVNNMALCGMQGFSGTRICDPNGIISFTTRKTVNTILLNILRSTRSPCANGAGFKVAFVLMNKMQDQNGCNWNSVCNAKRIAHGLMSRFGVNRPNCKDGVLVLFAMQDRQFYITYGPAVKIYFPQSTVNSILSQVKGNLRSSNYNQAVITAANLVQQRLKGKAIANTGVQSTTSRILVGVFACCIIACLCALCAQGQTGRRGPGYGRPGYGGGYGNNNYRNDGYNNYNRNPGYQNQEYQDVQPDGTGGGGGSW